MDQLLKVGLDETMCRCQGALVEDRTDAGVCMTVDSYRTAVCAQLESLEAEFRNPVKGKKSRPVFSFLESDDEPLVQSTSHSR